MRNTRDVKQGRKQESKGSRKKWMGLSVIALLSLVAVLVGTSSSGVSAEDQDVDTSAKSVQATEGVDIGDAIEAERSETTIDAVDATEGVDIGDAIEAERSERIASQTEPPETTVDAVDATEGVDIGDAIEAVDAEDAVDATEGVDIRDAIEADGT